MATFKDSEGREWRLKLNFRLLEQVQDRAGVDIDALFDKDSKEMEKLGDKAQLFAVLWVLCEKQAKADKVEPESFAEGFDGDTFDAASKALLDAFADFSPARQRPVIRALTGKIEEVANLEAKRATEKIAKLNPETMTAPATSTSAPSESATSARGSPASIPDG